MRIRFALLLLLFAIGATAQRSLVDLTSLAKPASAPSKIFVTNGSSLPEWVSAAGILTAGTGIDITGNTISLASSGGFLLDGGNTAGTTVTAGTNDAQSFALETGGTNRLLINSLGRVAIGPTSPTASLHLSQTSISAVSSGSGTAATTLFTFTGTAGGATSASSGTVFGGNGGGGSITGGAGGATTGTPGTGFGGSGGSLTFTGGNGGSGTTFGGSAGFVEIAGGTGGFGATPGSAGYASIKGGNAFTGGGGAGGNIFVVPGIGDGAGANGNIFLGLSPSLTARGNVKIGGSSPPDELLALGETGAKLGNLSLAGSTSGKVIIQPAAAAGAWTFTLPTSAGTNGYVLQTDGSGNASWVAPSGGSTDLTFSGSSSPVMLQSSTGADVTFAAGSSINLAQSGNTLTISSSGLNSGTSFSGDVSGTFSNLQLGSGVIQTGDIQNSAVTYTKIQQMNSGQLLGRASGAGLGAPGAITLSARLTSTGSSLDLASQSASTGQVLKWNGSSWAPDADYGGPFSGTGAANQVAYFSGTDMLASSANFYFDGTNAWLSSLGVGSGSAFTPATPLHVSGTIRTDGTGSSAGAAQLVLYNTTSGTGRQIQLLSENAGTFSVSSDLAGTMAAWDGTTGTLTQSGKLKLLTLGASSTGLLGISATGEVSPVSLGPNMSFTSGTLDAVSGGSGGSGAQSWTDSVAVTLVIGSSPYHNYNPGGSYSTSSTIFATTSDDVTMTGLTGGTTGRLMTIHNDGANTLTLANESGSSSAINRFSLGADMALEADESAIFQYMANRWRCIGTGLTQSHEIVYTYSSPGTYTVTVPARAKAVSAVIVGAGGGGGSGEKGAAGTARTGGSGGGAGAVTIGEWALTTLGTPANLTVTVGAGGTGGAATTSNGSAGSQGGSGGDTKIATSAGEFIFASGGTRGFGGPTSGSATGGAAGNVGMFFGSAGGNGTAGVSAGSPSQPTSIASPSGGGGGGGVSTSNSGLAGGNVGATYYQLYSLVSGASAGTGTAGANGTVVAGRWTGNGGAGGGGRHTGSAGAGGNGNRGGGGGGGGGATDDLGDSGAGGSGGDGWVQLVFRF